MVKPLVKICGLTRLEDALEAALAGADFLGFIFVPGTPRAVNAAQIVPLLCELRRCLAAAKRPMPRCVGVFRNVAAAEIRSTVTACGLDLIQLHGNESPALAAALGCDRVWRALTLRTPQDLETAVTWPCAAVLADSPGGGSGQTCDWQLAAELARRRPSTILAGGLTPDNVAAAVRQVQPWAIDLSSGLEGTKGIKDHAKIRALFAALS